MALGTRKAVRSNDFHRVDSCTSSARPRPRPIRITVVSTVYLSVKTIESTEEPVADRVVVVLREVDALVATQQRPVGSRHPHYQQERNDEEHHDEERGRRGVQPAGQRSAPTAGRHVAEHGRAAAAGPRRRYGHDARSLLPRFDVEWADGSVGRRSDTHRPMTPLVTDRGRELICSLSASTSVAVPQHGVAHQRQPRAVRGVERLLEVQRHRGLALAGDLVDGDHARVGLRSTALLARSAA